MFKFGDKVVVITKEWDTPTCTKFGSQCIVVHISPAEIKQVGEFDHKIVYETPLTDEGKTIYDDYYDTHQLRLVTKLDKALK